MRVFFCTVVFDGLGDGHWEDAVVGYLASCVWELGRFIMGIWKVCAVGVIGCDAVGLWLLQIIL